MIEAATMKRIARIKGIQRDERRARMQEAEERVKDAESLLERRHGEVRAASDAFGASEMISPLDLELRARAVVESSLAAVRAKEALTERERALDEGRALRIEAEREVRGLDLARARMRKLEEARLEKAENALIELRTGRRA